MSKAVNYYYSCSGNYFLINRTYRATIHRRYRTANGRTDGETDKQTTNGGNTALRTICIPQQNRSDQKSQTSAENGAATWRVKVTIVAYA